MGEAEKQRERGQKEVEKVREIGEIKRERETNDLC